MFILLKITFDDASSLMLKFPYSVHLKSIRVENNLKYIHLISLCCYLNLETSQSTSLNMSPIIQVIQQMPEIHMTKKKEH